MNKAATFVRVIELRETGTLFSRDDSELEDLFKESIDRFCAIMAHMNGAKRVLNIDRGRTRISRERRTRSSLPVESPSDRLPVS